MSLLQIGQVSSKWRESRQFNT